MPIKTVTIWRVETAKPCALRPDHTRHPHYGPWNARGVDHGVKAYREAIHMDSRCNKRDPSDHPRPYGDIQEWSGTDRRVFGCRTLETLRMWFPSRTGRRAMAEAGYIARCYRVPATRAALGTFQAAFDPYGAECCEVKDLETLRTLPLTENLPTIYKGASDV